MPSQREVIHFRSAVARKKERSQGLRLCRTDWRRPAFWELRLRVQCTDYQGWVYFLFILCSKAAPFISFSLHSFATPIISLLIWMFTLTLITVGGVFWPGQVSCSQCPIHGLHWKPRARFPRLKVGRIPYQLLICLISVVKSHKVTGPNGLKLFKNSGGVLFKWP